MKFKKQLAIVALTGTLVIPTIAVAQEYSIPFLLTKKETLYEKVSEQLPKIYATMDHPEIMEIEEDPDGSIHSVFLENGDHLVFSNNAKKVIISMRGEINVIDLEAGINVTEGVRSKQVQKIIDNYPPMYTVSAQGEEKARIYVAKDPQCGYCKKLEKEIPTLSAQGIAVEMYPLAIFPGSMEVMRQTGCSKNPEKTYELLSKGISTLGSKVEQKAAIMGVDLTEPSSEDVVMNALVLDYAKEKGLYTENCSYPVKEIALSFNAASLNGTPAIFTSKAQLIRGYVNASTIINAVQ